MVTLGSDLEEHAISGGYMAIYKEAKQLFDSGEYSTLSETLYTLLENNDTRSYRTLAQDLLPELFEQNSDVAIKLIHLTMEQVYSDYSVDKNVDRLQVSTSRTSRVKSNANKERNSSQAILDSLDRIPYSENEILFLINLINVEVCLWKKCAIKGKPNWKMIAVVLNAHFGNKRTPQAVSEMVKRLRETNDSRLVTYANTPIEKLTAESNFYIEDFILNIILEKDLYLLHAQEIASIVTNTSDLRSYAEIAKQVMPQEYELSPHACEQIMVIIIDLLKCDSTIEFDVDLYNARQYLIHGNRSRQVSSVEHLFSEDIVRYSRDEIICIVNATRCAEATWKTSNNKLKVDYSAVANIVNMQIHNGIEVRSAERISNIIRWYRSKRKNMMKKFSMYVESNPEYFPDIDDVNVSAESIADFYFYNLEAFLASSELHPEQ